MTITNVENYRVDDIPLLLGIMGAMGIQAKIDEQVKPHGLWQGVSVGTIVVVWLSYILTEQDHRLEPVREWVKQRQRLFNVLLGIELRETDFTDDRLANVLTMLGVEESQGLIDQAMNQEWITVYELPTDITRYDSTTIAVYQAVDEAPGGIIGYGHSKDHRPELAQFKVMLSSLDMGLPLTCRVVNGKRADDGLYIPAYKQVTETMGHNRFLAVGDSKMGSWENRVHFGLAGSWYLCPYRAPAAKGDPVSVWIETALNQRDVWQDVRQINEETGEVKTIAHVYEWSRQQQAYNDKGQRITWRERVLVTHSLAMQQGLISRRLSGEVKLFAALNKLRLPPQRGRKRYRTEAELQTVVDDLLARFHLTDVVTVSLTGQKHPAGGQRWRVADFQRDQLAWDQMVDRLGWQIYLTNVPRAEYDAPQIIHTYRRQPHLERSISLLKTRHLHLRPVFLHDPQRIVGLTWLLVLALRVMLLSEFRIRRQLKALDEALVGLKSGSKSTAFQRPTFQRVLSAFSNITWSIFTLGDTLHFHLTPLNDTHLHVLRLLDLSPDIYTRLTCPSPKPLLHLRE